MAVAEAEVSKVPNVRANLLASTAEITVVEDHHSSASKQPDRRKIIAKVAWEPVQTLTSFYTEVIAAVISCRIEACTVRGVGPVVPRTVPVSGAMAVVPRLASLSIHRDSRKSDANRN